MAEEKSENGKLGRKRRNNTSLLNKAKNPTGLSQKHAQS